MQFKNVKKQIKKQIKERYYERKSRAKHSGINNVNYTNVSIINKIMGAWIMLIIITIMIGSYLLKE